MKDVNYRELLGNWYSVYDGKQMEDYKCLQIKIEEYLDDEQHFIFKFHHGFTL